MSVDIGPSPAIPGEQVKVAFIVSNDGTSPVNNVSVQAQFPTGLNSVGDGFFITNAGNVDCTNGIGGNGACDSTETIIWTVGTVNPGDVVQLDFSPPVSSDATTGSALTWEVDLLVANDVRTTKIRVLDVAERALDLEIDANRSPVADGEQLTYTLNYGNRSANSVDDTELRFPLPAGASLVSSTGGTLDGSDVVFDLGTVATGQVGRQQVVVQVDGGLANGELLEIIDASIGGTWNFVSTISRADHVATWVWLNPCH